MQSTSVTVETRTLPVSVVAGAMSGLIAGIPLGIIMQARDMMPMVADLLGDPSTGFGWLVHLFHSAVFGAMFALLYLRVGARPVVAMGPGLAFGVFWWVVDALWIMPVWLDMSEMVFEVGTDQWWSLAGHLIYGLLLGGLYVLLRPMLGRSR